MIAKVNFNLISGKDNGLTYSFRTNNPKLKRGDVIVVDSQGEHQLANFDGYDRKSEYKPTKDVIEKLTPKQIKQYWNEVEKRLLKEPLQLAEQAYTCYCDTFLKNENTTFEDARKKLTRNVILSSNFNKGKPKMSNRSHVFYYGTMEIRVKGNKIIHIKKNDVAKNFTKNKRKYHYLNEHLGLVGK